MEGGLEHGQKKDGEKKYPEADSGCGTDCRHVDLCEWIDRPGACGREPEAGGSGAG